MFKVAANISALFREAALLERFSAARNAGFDGVELQFPYVASARELARAAKAAEMPVVLVNAPVTPEHPFGLAGRPEMRESFRSQLPRLCEYAEALKVSFVHVLAGRIEPSDDVDRNWHTYIENLLLAADALRACNVTVLIEPLNAHDMPNYLLGSLEDAQSVLDRCGRRVGLQFDAYHVARMGLDPATELERLLPSVFHVQFADAPGRHEPGTGLLDFKTLLNVLRSRGYGGWLSAEYTPAETTGMGLEWLSSWRHYAM